LLRHYQGEEDIPENELRAIEQVYRVAYFLAPFTTKNSEPLTSKVQQLLSAGFESQPDFKSQASINDHNEQQVAATYK